MSVADKLLRAKADLDAVYEKGVADGKAQGGGGDDAFWDAFQANGERNNYSNAFRYFPADAFYPKYDIILSSAESAFHSFNKSIIKGAAAPAPLDLAERLQECGVNLIVSPNVSILYLFQSANISTFPSLDISGCQVPYLFAYCENLHTVGTITMDSGTKSTSYLFLSCSALVNVSFSGEIPSNISFENCSLLSMESIESIVSHLSDTATGKTLTLSKTAVDNAFKTDINPEGSTTRDWAMLVSTKNNWTITLS